MLVISLSSQRLLMISTLKPRPLEANPVYLFKVVLSGSSIKPLLRKCSKAPETRWENTISHEVVFGCSEKAIKMKHRMQ